MKARLTAAVIALFLTVPVLTQEWLVVDRVVDGDTVVLANIGTVRLIGVDTPETVDPRKPVQAFGREASAFLTRLIRGKMVRLDYDRTKKDKYGRTLAYLYLPDGTFVNAEIVKQGYGHALTTYPFKHLEQFRAFEREAREASRGMWAAAAPAAQVVTAPIQRPLSVVPQQTAGAKTPDGRCHGITKEGDRCKRNVSPGKTYCYQHGDR